MPAEAQVKYAPPLAAARCGYMALQMALLIVAATVLIFCADGWPLGFDLSLAFCLLLGLSALGGLLDHRRWAAALEITRLAATLGLLVYALI